MRITGWILVVISALALAGTLYSLIGLKTPDKISDKLKDNRSKSLSYSNKALDEYYERIDSLMVKADSANAELSKAKKQALNIELLIELGALILGIAFIGIGNNMKRKKLHLGLFLLTICCQSYISNNAEAQSRNSEKTIKIKVLANISEIKKDKEIPDSIIYRKPLSVDNYQIDTVILGTGNYFPNFDMEGIESLVRSNHVILEDRHFERHFFSGKVIKSGEVIKYDTTVRDLNFGELKSSSKPGALFIGSNQRVLIGGISGSSVVDDKSSAVINIEGEKNFRFSIILPDSVVIKSSDGKNSMLVRYISLDSDNFILDSSGRQTFNISALLLVNANQAPGDYEGTIDLLVRIKEPIVIYKE